MTLRQWYAGQALAGMRANPSLSLGEEDIFEWAFGDADAMIEFEKEETPKAERR